MGDTEATEGWDGPISPLDLGRVCLVSRALWAEWGWIHSCFSGVSKTCSLGEEGDFVRELILTSTLQQFSHFEYFLNCHLFSVCLF